METTTTTFNGLVVNGLIGIVLLIIMRIITIIVIAIFRPIVCRYLWQHTRRTMLVIIMLPLDTRILHYFTTAAKVMVSWSGGQTTSWRRDRPEHELILFFHFRRFLAW